MKLKKQKRNEGDIVEIDLGDGTRSYGRVLPSPLMAFYNLRAKDTLTLDAIVRAPILFKVDVMNYAIKDRIWPVIGHMPLTPELKESPRFFKKDPINGKLSITITGGGDEVPATAEECRGLECAAVWEPEHIVGRLKDHFAGRPNVWVERFRP